MKRVLRWAAGAIVIALAGAALADGAPGTIPVQNNERGERPPEDSAAAGARLLLEAIAKDDPGAAREFFFPLGPFEILKESWNPARYHGKLLGWYEEDIHAEHRRFRKGSWSFVGLQLGRCRWTPVGREGNKIAYWSCRGNTVTATDGQSKRRFEIHTLINWGNHWYVTHLGPIRK